MIEVSAGIIIDGNRVLCFKKGLAKYDYLSHKYEFPGGKIESGENPRETLVREFKEELDACISGDEITEFITFDYNYPDFSVRIHSFIIPVHEFVFHLKEHVFACWVERKALNSIDWVDADRVIVQRLQS